MKKNFEAYELAVVQYMKRMSHFHCADEPLGCKSLRRAAASHSRDKRNLEILREKDVSTVLEEWFVPVFFQSIVSTTHVSQGSIARSPFTMELPWTSLSFSMSRFCRDSAMRTGRV